MAGFPTSVINRPLDKYIHDEQWLFINVPLDDTIDLAVQCITEGNQGFELSVSDEKRLKIIINFKGLKQTIDFCVTSEIGYGKWHILVWKKQAHTPLPKMSTSIFLPCAGPRFYLSNWFINLILSIFPSFTTQTETVLVIDKVRPVCIEKYLINIRSRENQLEHTVNKLKYGKQYWQNSKVHCTVAIHASRHLYSEPLRVQVGARIMMPLIKNWRKQTN